MAEAQNDEPLPEPPAASDAAAPVPAPVPATASSLDAPSAATQFAPSMILRERQIAQGKLDRGPLAFTLIYVKEVTPVLPVSSLVFSNSSYWAISVISSMMSIC